jgi:hypothetical protein
MVRAACGEIDSALPGPGSFAAAHRMRRAIHLVKELTMNAKTLSRLAIMLAAATAIASGATAFAQTPPGPQPGGGEHHGPPPEAIAACKALKLSQPCSFTSPRGVESGTCFQPDASKPLACRPAAPR